jgi:hypothetical protein
VLHHDIYRLVRLLAIVLVVVALLFGVLHR